VDRRGFFELPVPREIAVVRLSRRAMATGWEIVLPWESDRPAEPVGRDLFDLLDRLEAQLTVYRETSEVSRVNRSAARGPIRVEPGLFDLLRLAGAVHEATEGCFDAATGALIKAWGFFKGPRAVPSPARLAATVWGWKHVVLGDDRTIRFLTPGVELNFGSIGKGYALDRLAERMTRRWKIRAALLHGGSSSLYAKGDPHGTGHGWAVDIRHPWQRERVMHRVHLRDQALGTSAATFQHLEHEGRKLGHVLDPRSGWPAGGIDSASVIAPTAALADALSTAFYAGGVELARRYCSTHPGVTAVLLPEGADSPLILGE
jgi:thiamine biosynthesis lipoprotein